MVEQLFINSSTIIQPPLNNYSTILNFFACVLSSCIIIIMSLTKKLTHQQHIEADRDHKKAAAAARLRYVLCSMEGITRVRKGKGNSYYYQGQKITDREQLERIRKLAIPPSWTEVWICPFEDGHIQATGLDLNRRKQYRYHSTWNLIRNETKFHRLYEFGKTLPGLRKRVAKALNGKLLSEEKVLAAAISLMERTYIRVGNNDYEKRYGSYGLTTLKDKHVTIKKDQIRFLFIGKKGLEHDLTLRSKKLASIIKECRDIPGKELFQYYDPDGNRKKIDSGMLNNYIKELTGNDFSAKDFRTWAGSLHSILCFRSIGPCGETADTKKNVLQMLDSVSGKLGNSRNICKKYYVHPGIVRLYEENKLLEILEKAASAVRPVKGLSNDEVILLQVLKKCF
jgi:DNA topoisomerase I